MNQAAIHLRQTQHSKSTILQSKIKVKQNKERKREKERRKINKEVPTILLSGGGHRGWSHIPGAELLWGPKAGLRQSRGSWGGSISKGAPMDMQCLDPLWMRPQSPDPGGPSESSGKSSALKGWWTLWSGKALKNHLASTSPSGGAPTSTLLLWSRWS